MFSKIICEGIDNIGKSSLIDAIMDKYGFYQIIHCEKPKKLWYHEDSLFAYQKASFENLFRILRLQGAKIICDRSHLGEAVYSHRYRSYSGDYVFDMEKNWNMDSEVLDIGLILLTTSDFSIIKDDGKSFDSSKQEEEQNDFVSAFSKSIIPNKLIIDVCNGNGGFKTRFDILEEIENYVRH